MDCFIKKIFLDKVDEGTHSQFVRFGKGQFKNKAALKLQNSSKIKVGGSFEYAKDFAVLVSELANVNFSGVVMSKEKLDIEGEEKKKAEIYVYEVENITSDKIKEITPKTYILLLDAEGQGITLKCKKKLPKPGKSGDAKVDDKFCQIEADPKYLGKIKEALFWDIPECKKASVAHDYEITGLIMPEGEKDFEKIRIMTKRKGKITRKVEFDKKPLVKEREMIV